MFKTRFRFRCSKIVEMETSQIWELIPAYPSGKLAHENYKYWPNFANGRFTVCIDKKHYKGPTPELGQHFHIDITEVEKS